MESLLLADHRIKLPNGGEVHICSLGVARHIYADFDWVTSLLDPPDTQPGFAAKEHLVLHVDDVERASCHDRVLSKPEVEMATGRIVRPGGKGLIHCHGGVSRSTAIGIMTAFRNGASLEAIRSGIDWDYANPNPLILKWSKQVCGTDLGQPVADWMKELGML